MLENNVDNMTLWLSDPEKVKPGDYMADVIKPSTWSSPDEVRQVAEFLETLKPAGGCFNENAVAAPGASPEASPAASPAASPEASPVASPVVKP
jgi:hypothetical protein